MAVLYIALLTVAASMIGTVSGFGLSTIMIPILLFFFPLAETLLLVGLIHWFNDIWKMFFFRQGVFLKLLATFGLAGIVGSFLGAKFLMTTNGVWLYRTVGFSLITYVVFLTIKPNFKLYRTRFNKISGGFISGLFEGIFGMGGAIRGAFLTAFDLPKARYIFTAAMIAFFIDSTRIITYFFNGTKVEERFLWGLLAFAPAALIGTKLGQVVVKKIPQERFRPLILLFIFLVGIRFLFFPSIRL